LKALSAEHLARAVHNNALWCDAICRSHGCPGEFLDDVWVNRHRAPPFYPNVVTLTGVQGSSAQLAAIHDLILGGIVKPWAVKDSFCTLDLAPLGFRVLFEATWIWRPPSLVVPINMDIAGVHWAQVTQPPELVDWEAAWRGPVLDEPGVAPAHIFLPALLADPAIAFIAAYRDQRIVSGAIANRTGDVVGLSNVLAPAGDAMHFWAGCVGAVTHKFPGLPLVGYERGDDLAITRSLGFEPMGALRVWAAALDT
jgi:hypothetical protein